MLRTTLKKTSPIIASVFALILTACPGGQVPGTGTTPGTGGTEVASIAGNVTKEDGTMATNATVVLINNGTSTDEQIQRTGSDGLYKFNKVGAGNYRVAFVIQTEQERKDKTPIAYDANGKSGQYFGAITTKNFDYDGDQTKTFQVPAFNVGWTSMLRPNGDSVDFGNPLTISWEAPKSSGSVDYNVLIKDSNDIPFYKTENQSSTKFVFTPSLTTGNQGNNTGKLFENGKKYYYIVNAVFNDTSSAGPTIAYGNTANASFTTK